MPLQILGFSLVAPVELVEPKLHKMQWTSYPGPIALRLLTAIALCRDPSPSSAASGVSMTWSCCAGQWAPEANPNNSPLCPPLSSPITHGSPDAFAVAQSFAFAVLILRWLCLLDEVSIRFAVALMPLRPIAISSMELC